MGVQSQCQKRGNRHLHALIQCISPIVDIVAEHMTADEDCDQHYGAGLRRSQTIGQ